MKKLIGFLMLALTVTIPAYAQSNLPGWDVTINGNFSNISSAPTNNGFMTSEAVRISTNFALRSDQMITLQPTAGSIVLGKVEYRRLLSDFIRPNTAFAINTATVEPFINAGVGKAQSNTTTGLSASKFAWGIGGGFDVSVGNTGMFTLRPLDVTYVRTSLLNNGGQFIGNHLQLAAGLGLRFGSVQQMMENKVKRFRALGKRPPVAPSIPQN